MKRLLLKREYYYMKDHEIAEWLVIANDDVSSAEDLKDKHIVNSYYHCSQAVEKYLKCFLFINNEKNNKNHYLSETLDRCIKRDNSFSSILAECNDMTQLIKNIRYPGRTIPTKNDLSEAFELIQKIKELKPIQDIFNNLINKFGNNWESVLFKQTTVLETDFSSKDIFKLEPME